MLNDYTQVIDSLLKAILERVSSVYFAKISFTAINRQAHYVGVKMMILTTEEKVTLTIAPITPAGNPARVDGIPVWSVSDPAIATLTVSGDGMSAEIVSTALGQTVITVEVDADLDQGEVRTLTGMMDITVVEPEAVTMTIEAGAPVLK